MLCVARLVGAAAAALSRERCVRAPEDQFDSIVNPYMSFGRFSFVESRGVQAILSILLLYPRISKMPLDLPQPGRFSGFPMAVNHGKNARHEKQRRHGGKQEATDYGTT